MTRSKKLYVAVALIGVIGAIAGRLPAPFDQSARAADGHAAAAAERIDAAFSLVQPHMPRSLPVRVAKGDLSVAPACAGQTWPNIAADCLVTADGSPARKARVVTVGYQSGEAESVLVRLPISEVAMR